jgi:hypothetical protein
MIQPSQPRYKQPIPQNRISNLDMAANSFYSASTNFLIAYHLLTKHPGVILNAALHNDAEPMLEPVSKSFPSMFPYFLSNQILITADRNTLNS